MNIPEVEYGRAAGTHRGLPGTPGSAAAATRWLARSRRAGNGRPAGAALTATFYRSRLARSLTPAHRSRECPALCFVSSKSDVSRELIAARCMLGVTCEQTAKVSIGLECPRISWTILGLTPLAKSSVAQLWRRS